MLRDDFFEKIQNLSRAMDRRDMRGEVISEWFERLGWLTAEQFDSIAEGARQNLERFPPMSYFYKRISELGFSRNGGVKPDQVNHNPFLTLECKCGQSSAFNKNLIRQGVSVRCTQCGTIYSTTFLHQHSRGDFVSFDPGWKFIFPKLHN